MLHRCIVCGNALQHLLTLENMPESAQNIPSFNDLENDHPISLTLTQCKHCGLVQFDTNPVSYYRDVIRAGGGTKTMSALRKEEYDRLLTIASEKGIQDPSFIEIGCGRGEFMKMWNQITDRPWRITGIENKPELVETAVYSGLNVHVGFAEDDASIPCAPYDGFVQFNFLEHQPDPRSMLHTIWLNLKENAVGLVTVPSFEYIMEHDGYYELIHDHIANYTTDTLRYLLENSGFHVLESRIVNRDTIEMIVQKTPLPEQEILPLFNGQYIDVKRLSDNYSVISQDIASHIESLTTDRKTLAIWGASHQGFTLAATTKLGGKVKYIIDSAPFKQGRFSPASHIPIVSPDYFLTDPVDEILIVAPGYTKEIAEIIRSRYGQAVSIIVLLDEKIRPISEVVFIE